MAETGIDETDEERMRQLLAVDQRLQEAVAIATADAARRIAAARIAREARLATARAAADRADAEMVNAEREAHEKALAAIETAGRSALDAMASLPESRVDELARWAIMRTIADVGEPP